MGHPRKNLSSSINTVTAFCILTMLCLVVPAFCQDKLPGGVNYRLREAKTALERGERAMDGQSSTDWRIRTAEDSINSAKAKLEEIKEQFSGEYSPEHPDVLAVVARIEQLQKRVAELKAESSNKTAPNPAGDETQKQWLAKINPFIIGIGRPDHDPQKYLIPSATQEQAEMQKRMAIYVEARNLFAEYKKSNPAQESDSPLSDAVEKLETLLTQFEESCKQYAQNDIEQAEFELNHADTFISEQEKKQVAGEAFYIIDKSVLTNASDVLERGAALCKPDDPRVLKLKNLMQDLKTRDLKLRDARVADTKMRPESYQGPEAEQIRQKASEILMKDHPGAKILKTAIVSDSWKEESVLEYTDTTQSALRYRVTRSHTVQIAAKADNDCKLYTLDISQDKNTNSEWGPLCGHIMYTDRILEENVR